MYVRCWCNVFLKVFVVSVLVVLRLVYVRRMLVPGIVECIFGLILIISAAFVCNYLSQ